MNFVKHSNLEGLHAIFSPSQSSWLRYDDDKALEVYSSKQAAQIGSRIHAWAKETIDLGIKQPRSPKTIYAYVNDAIGFKMSTEVVLFYSERFFGTADSISFKNGFLRIHDLKTGKIPADMEQLRIYAALFCLEYKVKPTDIKMELRIYQNDDTIVLKPEANDISVITKKIIEADKIVNHIKEMEG